MSIEPPTEQLGMEGETCAQCGAALATDQRYCLNCGEARTEPRLDFQKHLSPVMGGPPAPITAGVPATAGAPAGAGAPLAMSQVNPITAIFAIALLAVMLLLGVLIGKDDDPTTVAAAPAATTTTPTTAAVPTEAADKGAKDKSKKGGGSAPGEGSVVQGGSGDTTGIAAANEGASVQDNLKGPDVVATQGEEAELDPNGPAGGGSDAVCIGC